MSGETKYTPQELARLTGEAMIAWSKDPSVKLQSYNKNTWSDCNIVNPVDWCGSVCWSNPKRIKPSKRTVPLDQSDFVGPNRVTHVRAVDEPDVIHTATTVCGRGIWLGFSGKVWSFKDISAAEISRDNGLTWGPAEKEVEE